MTLRYYVAELKSRYPGQRWVLGISVHALLYRTALSLRQPCPGCAVPDSAVSYAAKSKQCCTGQFCVLSNPVQCCTGQCWVLGISFHAVLYRTALSLRLPVLYRTVLCLMQPSLSSAVPDSAMSYTAQSKQCCTGQCCVLCCLVYAVLYQTVLCLMQPSLSSAVPDSAMSYAAQFK